MQLKKDKDIKNILIRSTNWVGDAIMTTPAIQAIRQNFPNAK
ncbi:MAG: lipopolysaccharide heptosyltransferase II, partial [Deltaproteobacteria bacterium]|nr:lipopolysaccharide heptosyltransferase II [Deltaproteobacteria bacterium]